MPDEDHEFLNQENLDEIEDEDIEEESIEPEENPANVIFENGKGYVEPVELLHLIERKRVVVSTPSGDHVESDHIVTSLLDEDPDLWVRYLVFRDLRSRGYAVRKGFGAGIGFRVYARGDHPGTTNAKELIYVLKEGIPISLSDLDLITKTASSSRKSLIFALVDQNGEVNYYKVAQSTLRDLSGDNNER